LHNAHPLLALKISRKKLVRVYNAHGLLKKIVVGNVRIKCQSYIFLIVLSVFLLLRTIIFFKLEYNRKILIVLSFNMSFSHDFFCIRMFSSGYEM